MSETPEPEFNFDDYDFGTLDHPLDNVIRLLNWHEKAEMHDMDPKHAVLIVAGNHTTGVPMLCYVSTTGLENDARMAMLTTALDGMTEGALARAMRKTLPKPSTENGDTE